MSVKKPNRPETGKETQKSPAKATTMRSPRSGAVVATGGKVGNRGGSGRPPSAIREMLRGSFADRIAVLTSIADGRVIQRVKAGETETETLVSADIGDRIKAIDMLAKYGLGTIREVSVENVRERVSATLDVIQERTSPEQFASIVSQLQPIWA